MKVLTAAQMREIDRRTVEMGVAGETLMERAGSRVVEFLEQRYAPLADQRIAIFCGKGNNGGDGLVVARQLFERHRPRFLRIVLLASPDALKGDAALNYRRLVDTGCPITHNHAADLEGVTLIIDALLGTGLSGPANGAMLDCIRRINSGFQHASIVSVDIPSALASDTGKPLGESVRAHHTVTFTAPKVGQVLPPNCERVGELHIREIGSPPDLFEKDDSIFLSLVQPAQFRPLLAPRPAGSHKGTFGHVLVVAGSRGKTGAAAMCGMAALRAGAGLVTVASEESAIPVIAAHAAELMTEPLPAAGLWSGVAAAAEHKTVVAIGPGLGSHPDTVAMVRRAFAEFQQPMVVDADALNALAGSDWSGAGSLRVLTPHPGEMARLCNATTAEIGSDRLSSARHLAAHRRVTVVLK